MRTVFSIGLLIISTSIFGQYGYQSGLIITTNNDTIQCYVPVQTNFGKKFNIKRSQNGEEETFLVSNVKYLANEFNVYETVIYKDKKKDKQKLMQIVKEGKLTLYLELIINSSGNSTPMADGTFTAYSAPTTTYVVRKNGNNYLITKRKFIDNITPITRDNSSILNKVQSKTLKYEDMELLVDEYNSNSN